MDTETMEYRTQQAGYGTKDNNSGQTEGEVAKAIETETAKLPSDLFLWAAVGAMGASLILQCMRQKHVSLFVGQWVAPFLLFGIYNKMVKQHGHDQEDPTPL